MKTVIITITNSNFTDLISALEEKKIEIIKKPFNNLYPNELLNKFGKNTRVIFITRFIKDILISLKNNESDKGINWIKNYYKNLNSDFMKYSKLFVEDTLNFEKLYDSYTKTMVFPVLFIKYENIYCENNKKTINMINNFLNTNLKYCDFNFKNINKLSENKEKNKKNFKIIITHFI